MIYSATQIKKFLTQHKHDNGLYDRWNGVKKEILAFLGFYQNYITYKHLPKRPAFNVPNWVTAATAYRDLAKCPVVKAICWTYAPGLPHQRLESTHARGVFVVRALKLVITYDPRRLNAKDYDAATLRHFNDAHNDFIRRFPKSFTYLTVYGSQVRSYDCEKRVIRFGSCCLKRLAPILASERPGPTSLGCGDDHCNLSISAICTYYVR